MQLRVLRFRSDENGNVRVGVFPQRQEILIGRFGGIALYGVGVQLTHVEFEAGKSFLAQKIKVGVTAGTRIDDGGKVPGKIICVTTVSQRKGKWDL
jgi:hypothetical protein